MIALEPFRRSASGRNKLPTYLNYLPTYPLVATPEHLHINKSIHTRSSISDYFLSKYLVQTVLRIAANMSVRSTTYSFNHSSTVIKQLARNAARTPPSDEDPPLVYIDRSLTILGRTFDTHTSERSKEFLAQREFIANGFRDVDRHFEKIDRRHEEVENKMDRRFEEVENKMDRRFEEVEKKMDRRFEEVEKKMDRRFEEVDRRFEKVDRRFNDIHILLENTAAITRNGHLRRMHQPINLIKVLKPAGDPNKFVWASYPQVPKHMKNTYILGQRAKGIFEPSWEGKSSEQSMYLMARCYVCTFCTLGIPLFTKKMFS